MKIYEQLGFSVDKARTLIRMVEEAVKEFKEVNKLKKEDPGKSPSELYDQWDSGKKDENGKEKLIEIDGKKYEVLSRFAVDEYWYGISEIASLPLESFFMGDPLQTFRDRVPFGFILQPTTSKDEIYIVIRGTQTKPEWWNNLAFKPGEKNFLTQEIGKVHRGFHLIYTKKNEGSPRERDDDDLPSMMSVIENKLKELDLSKSKVYITGHSLGAALATLAAAHVSTIKGLSEPPILYTFASPRVGDRRFAQYINKHLNHVYRIINSEDIISAVPLASARLLPEDDIEEIVENLKVLTSLLSKVISLLPNLDFYHVGQVIPFTIHKASVLENHIVATYAEELDKI